MNPDAEVILNEILKKDPEHLTTGERVFLRARQSYLKKSQLEEYASILEAEEIRVEQTQPTYSELLTEAKTLGYTGRRLSRPQLEEFIQNKKKNPFN